MKGSKLSGRRQTREAKYVSLSFSFILMSSFSKNIRTFVHFYIFDNCDKVEVSVGEDVHFIKKEAFAKAKANAIAAGWVVEVENEYLINM